MKAVWTLALALLTAASLLLPAAQASHFTSYTNYPTEHDDLGASSEPDFFGVTSVLGQPLAERTVDLNLDGIGEPSTAIPQAARQLAPGCTDDSGRRPSGLCGLWTIGALNGAEGTSSQNGVPANTVGIQGMSPPNAPGLTQSNGRAVRFLDSKVNGYYSLPLTGVTWVDLNHKVADTGAQALLRAVDPSFGNPFVAYETGHWAWYGKWADKNGNGVIDHLQHSKITTVNPPIAVEDANNEFQWYGNCLSFDGFFIPGWHCFPESVQLGRRIVMLTYVYPGNHHGDCGFLLLGVNEAACEVPADAPGKQVYCFADISSGRTLNRVSTGWCGDDLRTMDQYDERSGSDSLLGSQGSLTPDVTQDDRTGDSDWDTRSWTGALGWQAYYYDQSLLVTTTMVTGVNCAEDTSQRGLDLQTCRFLDVDLFASWSPGLGSLVQDSLKPTARSNWVFAREAWVPFNTFVDGVRNNRLFYDQNGMGPGTGPTLGQADDALADPGLAREPNTAGDSYPGAARGAFGSPDFEGKNTDYAGYRAAPRAFVDNQIIRALTYSHAIGSTVPIPGQSTCQLCVAGAGLTSTASPEPIPGNFPRQDHSRSLGPGRYFFAGLMGRWHDAPQTWSEDVFNPLTLGVDRNTYTKGPDGWVGNVVNATGTFYYKGYQDEECTQQGVTGPAPYGWCHPYLEGNLVDPQQDGSTTHGEWRGKCDESYQVNGGSASSRAIVLTPRGGTWTVPVFVMEKADFIDVPGYFLRGQFKDYTGKSTPIFVGIHCFDLEVTGGYTGTDLVLLPAGNLGLEVTVTLTALVPVGAGTETVVDADVFAPWGP